MNTLILAASNFTGPVLASGDSDGGNGFAFVLLFGGVIFYILIYLRYRNADKRHHHERETPAKLLNLRTQDTPIRKLTGLKSSTMSGANNTRVTGSQNTLTGGIAGLNIAGLSNVTDAIQREMRKNSNS